MLIICLLEWTSKAILRIKYYSMLSMNALCAVQPINSANVTLLLKRPLAIHANPEPNHLFIQHPLCARHCARHYEARVN